MESLGGREKDLKLNDFLFQTLPLLLGCLVGAEGK